MELEAKKKWLRRYREKLREVESLERLEAERRLAATGMAAKRSDGVPGPPVRANKAGAAEERHMEVRADLEEARAAAEKMRREILAAAAALGGHEAAVVRFRYINGCGWGEIQGITGFSRSWLLRIHKSALLRIECGQE